MDRLIELHDEWKDCWVIAKRVTKTAEQTDVYDSYYYDTLTDLEVARRNIIDYIEENENIDIEDIEDDDVYLNIKSVIEN